MIGGGRGAFIGAVHRMAAALDGHIELAAGCFSANPEKSRESGADLHLDPARVYADFAEMARQEAARPPGERLDFVSIVTRNSTHFAIASAFLKAGFNVVCEKPVTLNLAEARKLRGLVRRSGKVFALTHNYTGYPMVKEARAKLRAGELGRILKIVVEYPQGYATGAVGLTPDDGAEAQISSWRADPAVAGASNCMGDIGTHAANLAHYITGLDIDAVCADLTAFAGGALDDDGNCLLRFDGGAKGILYASQISNGEENNLVIRVYGTKAALEWHQEHPNELVIKTADRPVQIWRRGNTYLSPEARMATRLPSGHPEAFIEAFANVYCSAIQAIADEVFGHKPPRAGYDFPTIDDGVRGMAFIETVVKSSRAQAKWTKFPKV
jgi:predicted dehydrogenase